MELHVAENYYYTLGSYEATCSFHTFNFCYSIAGEIHQLICLFQFLCSNYSCFLTIAILQSGQMYFRQGIPGVCRCSFPH